MDFKTTFIRKQKHTHSHEKKPNKYSFHIRKLWKVTDQHWGGTCVNQVGILYI